MSDLIKRIDEAHFALLNGMNHEELDVLLRDCRAEIERRKYVSMTDDEFEHFANLVAEKEREACAQIADYCSRHSAVAKNIAHDIRARGQK